MSNKQKGFIKMKPVGCIKMKPNVKKQKMGFVATTKNSGKVEKKPKVIYMSDKEWRLLMDYFKEKGKNPKEEIAKILRIKIKQIREEIEKLESESN